MSTAVLGTAAHETLAAYDRVDHTVLASGISLGIFPAQNDGWPLQIHVGKRCFHQTGSTIHIHSGKGNNTPTLHSSNLENIDSLVH